MNFRQFDLSQLWLRFQGRYQRTVNSVLFRRLIDMRNDVPYISFTFDDFPRSALHTGGAILMQFGLRATYYASFGLMGKEVPPGKIFVLDDVKELLSKGHELGCHTYDHYPAFKTRPKVFEDSIVKNRHFLYALLPGAVFRSFSYPIGGPCPGTKLRTSRYFECCRGGGQTFNFGVADLNLLKGFFLEKKRGAPHFIQEVIDRSCKARGWLIFATHDIDDKPSPFGCTPSFFEDVVKYSLNSGAKILPVAKALDAIRAELLDGG